MTYYTDLLKVSHTGAAIILVSQMFIVKETWQSVRSAGSLSVKGPSDPSIIFVS